MQVINVALVGAGYSSRVFHLPFLKHDPHFCVRKVYERTSNNAAEWLPSAETVRDFDSVLTSDIDLVVITTPNQTHYEMAKAALQASKHVLVEKPLVATVAEAEELAELARQQGKVLYVYQNRRWDSHIATAKWIMEQGLLGEVVDCEIRFDRYAKDKNAKQWKEAGDKGTGLVYDLGVHLIDQALYLFGKPEAVYADVRYQHTGALVDDNFDIQLYYPNGFKMVLKASKYAREPSPTFVLHGKLGSYVKQNADNQEDLLKNNVQPVGENWNIEPMEQWGILHTELEGNVVRQPYPNSLSSYQNVFDDLYHAIVHNVEPVVKLDEVIFVLNIIEAVFESTKTGRKILLG